MMFARILFALLLFLPQLSLAADFTSASFVAKNPLTNLFGGFGSSTSFFSFLSGGQTVTGESSSTNFAVAAGFLYFDSFTPRSQEWRWYDDEASETPSVALAGEHVAPADVDEGAILKLRVTVKEIASIGQSGVKFALQFSTSSDFSTGAIALAESGSCTGSSVWCYADGGGADNGTITTALLSDADPCVAGVGQGCGTHNESAATASSATHAKDAAAEYEFTVTQSGATANTTYFFRLFDTIAGAAVPFTAGGSYPSLLTGGTTLSFSIGGLPSASSVEGVTTDVDTTSTGVSFGSLPQGTPVTGAQELTVTTNAGSGYRIYAFERQGLLSDGGSAITPVSGTNSAPVGWTSGCSGAGCYGYHAGDDVLYGGSTRFAADDTYAQFDGTPREVAFSSGPATSRSTAMLYRVEATGLQDAGSYSSNVVYIVVPVF